MLVTTATTGCSTRNEASDSSASATRNSPLPRRALTPADSSRPPMTNVGSSPPSASTLAIRLVVVVLPCVPATAMPCFSRISSASISARGTTGTPAVARGQHFGIVGGDCGRHHDDVGTGHVAGPVARSDARAELAQAPRRRGQRKIRAADLVTLRQQHLGDSAHAGAADADEVHALDLELHAADLRASAMQASATRSLASVRPTRRAAIAIASSRPRVNASSRSASACARHRRLRAARPRRRRRPGIARCAPARWRRRLAVARSRCRCRPRRARKSSARRRGKRPDRRRHTGARCRR